MDWCIVLMEMPKSGQWPDLKRAGLFRRNLFLNSLKALTCLEVNLDPVLILRKNKMIPRGSHTPRGLLFRYIFILSLIFILLKQIKQNLYIKVKLATVVENNQKAPFSIATTPRCRGGCYFFPWIAPLYTRYVPYIAECYARRYQVPFFESLVWRNLGLNLGLSDHWRTLYALGQWTSHIYINFIKYFIYEFWWNFSILDRSRKWLFSLNIVVKFFLVVVKSYHFLKRKFSEMPKIEYFEEFSFPWSDIIFLSVLYKWLCITIKKTFITIMKENNHFLYIEVSLKFVAMIKKK